MVRLMLGQIAKEHPAKGRFLQCSNNLFLVSDNKVDKATVQKSNKPTRRHKTTAVNNGLFTPNFQACMRPRPLHTLYGENQPENLITCQDQ